ncbi:hypothetical protein F2P81_004836 [Scophthalmus maximus]|uniref:Uncharacterized protein n=1 Tax=Scophthalmus maximus TaxID=52904 RepID=A0A6A4TFA3_SCOMX|nr:hypothetical protein F2P81_004836 [Scophthalmus maximus]
MTHSRRKQKQKHSALRWCRAATDDLVHDNVHVSNCVTNRFVSAFHHIYKTTNLDSNEGKRKQPQRRFVSRRIV